MKTINININSNLLNPEEVRGFIRYLLREDTSVKYSDLAPVMDMLDEYTWGGDAYLRKLIAGTCRAARNMTPLGWTYAGYFCRLLERSSHYEISCVLAQYNPKYSHYSAEDIDDFIYEVRESSLVY